MAMPSWLRSSMVEPPPNWTSGWAPASWRLKAMGSAPVGVNPDTARVPDEVSRPLVPKVRAAGLSVTAVPSIVAAALQALVPVLVNVMTRECAAPTES